MILSETLIDMKITEMLKQQKALLDEGFDIVTGKQIGRAHV